MVGEARGGGRQDAVLVVELFRDLSGFFVVETLCTNTAEKLLGLTPPLSMVHSNIHYAPTLLSSSLQLLSVFSILDS